MELKNRVRQYTNTIGTDNYSLNDTVSGFNTFAAAFSDGDETVYCATDGSDYEIGNCTISSSGLLLTRDSIIESTNSNNKVVWTAGNKDIFVTIDAAKLTDVMDIDISDYYTKTETDALVAGYATLDDAIAMSIALG